MIELINNLQENIDKINKSIIYIPYNDIIKYLESCKTILEKSILSKIISDFYHNEFKINIIDIIKINDIIEYESKINSKFYFNLLDKSNNIINLIPINQSAFIIFYYIGD